MKAVIVINYASEEDIGKKTPIRLKNEENEWVEEVVIKPMPHELDYASDWEDVDIIFRQGWNACLKEICDESHTSDQHSVNRGRQ